MCVCVCVCAYVCEVRVISHHLFWESEASVGSGPWSWSQCSSLGTHSCPRPRAAPWRYTDFPFPARWIAGCPLPRTREAHWRPSCRWSLSGQKESKQMRCENNAHVPKGNPCLNLYCSTLTLSERGLVGGGVWELMCRWYGLIHCSLLQGSGQS